MTTLLGLGLALATAVPVQAGRIHSTNDTAFEITRIVSQYQGGTSETIAAAESNPVAPIAGETRLFGWSHRFPEFAEVYTWRSGQGWRQLPPGSFTLNSEPATPPGTGGNVWTVVLTFSAAQSPLIKNAYVWIRIQPQPPGPFGDNIEAFWLR